jgi:RND family efflux transporter MFP subunit
MCAALAGAFALGFWFRGSEAGAHTTAPGRKVLYWHDPMHPAFRSDKPGTAPDCGMALEPVYEGEAPAAWKAPGGVSVAAADAHALGIRVGVAEKGRPAQTLRLFGRVTADETRVYKLFANSEGWVREISPWRVGSIVEKDELLATFFSREIVNAQQAYLYALSTKESRQNASDEQKKADEGQARLAEESLTSLGMSETQRREIAASRKTSTLMQVRAPAPALILARNVALGQRVDRSLELFRLADIRRVLVLADVFERDARLMPRGGRATVRYQGETLAAEVRRELPVFDAETRSFKLRLEVDNPRHLLRPDMFVQVEVPAELPEAVTVPSDAVIDSGSRRIVYVSPKEGEFEPREVETGWQSGGRVAVTRGLEAGERVVVSGTFLVDSESRIKLAAAGAAQAELDPVCGMKADPATALKAERDGKTRYFCSETCRKAWLGR